LIMLKYIKQLSEWQNLDTFKTLLEREDIESNADVVNDAGLGQWRDGWIAHATAKALDADVVRLIHPELQPDFEVRVGEQEFLYEATELMRPGRRRHDEVRTACAAGLTTVEDPVDNWVTRPNFLKALTISSEKKAGKRYPAGCRLVIYVNVGWINGPEPIGMSLDDQFGLQSLSEAAEAARQSFASVELLHQSRLLPI
jgi:hypothetical protein